MIGQFSDNLNASIFGGKVKGLSNLVRLGMKVPSGFGVSEVAHQYYLQNGRLSDEIKNTIGSALSNLNSELVIVRSSAIGEDSSKHSFAGQLDSIVVKNDLSQVLEATIKCYDALHNERVQAYQNISGKRLEKMALAIQEFFEADFSGVTFTVAPDNSGGMYTEFVSGRGEQLVSGEITPEKFYSHGHESQKEIPFNASALIEDIKNLKQRLGYELDIEWIIKDQLHYFVQARPITVENKQKVHWSNTNLNENYPDPISPLLYSIARDSYYHYFKNLAKLVQIDAEKIMDLEYDFSNSVGIWGGRIYYNMTSIHNILSSSPLHDYFKTAFNQFVGYTEDDKSNMKGSKSGLFRFIFRLFRLNIQLEKHVKTIEQRVNLYSNEYKTGSAKEARFYRFLDLRFNHWYHASLADFFAMIHYKLLARFTQKFYGKNALGVHNKLIQAIPGLVSSEPLNELWDISLKIRKNNFAFDLFEKEDALIVLQEIQSNPALVEIHEALESYLIRWGFRCSGELMFFKENYVDDPSKLISLIQGYLSNEAIDPREIINVRAQERIEAMREFRMKIIRKRHIFFPLWMFELIQLQILTSLCKQAISSRERVRYKQAEMYHVFKQTVFEIGEELNSQGRLENPRDILFLNYKEIGEIIAASSMFNTSLSEKISERKREFKSECVKTFPENFSTNQGERPNEIIVINSELVGSTFSGLAASGGKIKARVKVLDSVMESGKVNRGDILVTRQTDPGWAVVFPLIGGLVVERGGALSHGAIVAREFGIPAVVGVHGITSVLKDGDLVIVDGDSGLIQKLSDDR